MCLCLKSSVRTSSELWMRDHGEVPTWPISKDISGTAAVSCITQGFSVNEVGTSNDQVYCQVLKGSYYAGGVYTFGTSPAQHMRFFATREFSAYHHSRC